MFTSVNFRENVGADSLTVGGPGTAVFPANKTEVGTCLAGLGWLADLPLVSLVDLVTPGDEHHGADHGQVVGDQVSEA